MKISTLFYKFIYIFWRLFWNESNQKWREYSLYLRIFWWRVILKEILKKVNKFVKQCISTLFYKFIYIFWRLFWNESNQKWREYSLYLRIFWWRVILKEILKKVNKFVKQCTKYTVQKVSLHFWTFILEWIDPKMTRIRSVFKEF